MKKVLMLAILFLLTNMVAQNYCAAQPNVRVINGTQKKAPTASSESKSNEPVTGKNVTNIVLKNFTLVKYKETDWKLSALDDAKNKLYDILGNHTIASDDNSITIEIMGIEGKIILNVDFNTKKAFLSQKGKKDEILKTDEDLKSFKIQNIND